MWVCVLPAWCNISRCRHSEPPPSAPSSCCPFPVYWCDAPTDSPPLNARVRSPVLPLSSPLTIPFILFSANRNKAKGGRLHYLVAGAKIIVIAPRTYPTSFGIIHAFHWKTLWVISTTSWEIDVKKCESIRNVSAAKFCGKTILLLGISSILK